ncbi:proline-rich extensin-like protein EPR1 [Carya illinoinensis]|uniref:proline-rich extensin-like protein EPR1 n=1 Tax=Carya illinoinensis TaxID=32201 RepID=UPI001C71C284|nr:proline-rich extensin-like protein EPR1 [Carya illinoinensis]
MDKEEDKSKAKPSTPIPPTQGYYGPRNAYCPPFMMHPNSQPMPLFPTTFIYPPSSNAEESSRVEQTSQPPPMPPLTTMFIYPPSSSAEKSRQPLPMPHFPIAFIYPPSTNAEESARLQEVIQPTPMPPFPTAFIYPPSTNAEESGRLQQAIQPPPMPPIPTTFKSPSSSNAEESGHVQETSQPPSTSCLPSSTGEELKSTGKDLSNAETASNFGGTLFFEVALYFLGNTVYRIDVRTEAEEINEENSDKDRVEEPKPGMEFVTDNELMAYYKRYAKQEGFGVITQRTKREAD